MGEQVLPDSKYFQYFSHLYHGGNLIEWEKYNPLPDWDYPEVDKVRFTKLFLNKPAYIKDQHIVDLGCHNGFLSFICQHLGAKSTVGVNVRQTPLDVGNYAFNQLEQKNFSFVLGDVENQKFLLETCKNKDTVIFTGLCEYLKNPYLTFETLTMSDVKHLIFDTNCLDVSDAIIRYEHRKTSGNFGAYNRNNDVTIATQVSAPWIEMILYYFGWKIEYYDLSKVFNKNWFAVPNLTEYTPRVSNTLTILATKFEKDTNKQGYEF